MRNRISKTITGPRARGVRLDLATGALGIALGFTALPALAAPPLDAKYDSTWVAAWEASPESPRSPPTVFVNQTVREIEKLNIGAGRLRLRLSNEFGSKPLYIGAAHIALAGTNPGEIVNGSDRTITFNGKPTVTIPANGVMFTDPVDLNVYRLTNVAVSLYFPGSSGEITEHFFGLETAYLGSGNQTANYAMANPTTFTERPVLSGIEVALPNRPKVIAVLGDALSDGFGSTTDATHRWPDILGDRLVARHAGEQVAVINAAISGNRLLHDFIGPSAISRFDRDVLAQPRVSHLIILEGINDFGFPGARHLPDEEVSAQDVIDAYKQLIFRAHAHDIRVIMGTLPPFGPIPSRPGFYSDAAEAKREAVNTWIRANGKFFDGMIDFDKVLRDPGNPNRLLPAYDSGDHLNLNDAGYQAMANAIDLNLFN